ncbi:hypothetical protein BC832DRAFT_240248 [Gaertneriomyces semiglobifer]|nr:hypothetical protein BC832DRAFT_240248 [Gaertneriomyces semiglobifer]
MPTSISSLYRPQPTFPQDNINDATEFLNRNNVPQIVQQLLCAVLHERPDNPRDFLARKLEEMRNARARGQSLTLFTRENLTALFRIFDITGKGWITSEQYAEAMKSIGAEGKAKKSSDGSAADRIYCDAFVDEAYTALNRPQ